MPKRTAKQAAKPAASSLTKSVSWPPFKPRLPVLDLNLSLHPSSNKIALIPCFFPKSLCRDYVSFLKTLPLQTTPGRPKRGEAVRVNDRFQVDDPDFARRLWEDTGLREALLETEHANHLWCVNHPHPFRCTAHGRRPHWLAIMLLALRLCLGPESEAAVSRPAFHELLLHLRLMNTH
ncbi:hypothetical protein S40285_04230 [Stachybotrys chlorohalonatus IBT 40285]|uniref:Uncharacterized protein n=1 Tax=Stachybotrys chlorohalonatus (strain IBT 40285) TaxID=1283841 RepID=A0A084QJ93_STAC4|nr:hypothetical protein S40285_04230 [Stachybotrys chlorohalonata IBT 40285]